MRLENIMRGAKMVADTDLWTVAATPKLMESLRTLATSRSAYWSRNIFHPGDIPQKAYDIIIAFQLRTAPLAFLVQGARRILDLTDSLGLFRERLRSLHTGYFRQVVLWGIGASEEAWARRFDEVWVSGWQDARWLKEHGITAKEVPNAVREKEMLPAGDPHALLFVANLAYLPNRHGIRRFLSHVWPLLAENGYRLHLAGQGSEQLRGFGVTGYGFADDLKELYRKTGISISPVVLGTGTQNKILEAMGYGRPVVCGPEGLAALPEALQGCVQAAHRPKEWLDKLQQLQDSARYHRAAEKAWSSVPVAGEPVSERIRKGLTGK